MKPLYLKGFCFLNLSYIMDISRPWSSATAGTVSNSYFFFPWLYFLDLMDSFTYISDSLILCVRLIQYCKQFLKILGRFFTAIWFGQPLICLMYPILRCFFTSSSSVSPNGPRSITRLLTSSANRRISSIASFSMCLSFLTITDGISLFYRAVLLSF